jgi:hypothetical protein
MRLNQDDYIKKLKSFLPPPGTSISCEVGLSYGDYLRQMEEARLTFQRGRKRNQWRKAFDNSAGQMPLDLRAYIVAQQFDGDKKNLSRDHPRTPEAQGQASPICPTFPDRKPAHRRT